MRTRACGLSAAVLFCAAVPAFAQTVSPRDVIPLNRQTRAITLKEAMAIATAEADKTTGDEVCVELRVVSVCGKDGREAVAKLFEGKEAKTGEPKTAFLTANELKATVEACQKDRITTMMLAPRLTILPGDPATVRVVDTQQFTTAVTVKVADGKPVVTPTTESVELGQTFIATATPSKDGRFVELKVSYHDKQVKPNTPLLPVTTFLIPEGEAKDAKPVPFTQFVQMPKFAEVSVKQTATVPDGGTMAVYAGCEKVLKKDEFGPPAISGIPYLNRLFKNVGVSEVECDLVVFATATRLKEVAKVEPKVVQAGAWSPATTPSDLKVGPKTVASVGPSACDEVAKLVAAFRKACEAGKTDEAMRLAVQALAKDPTCFGR